MNRKLIFGDIHGCYDEFIALLNQIGVDETDEIISVGDIVDRGPKSLELYDFFKLRKNATVIMGNHERKHLNGVLSYAQEIVKVQFGSRYEEFVEWLNTLDYHYETEEAIIVHAFFEHDKSLANQQETVLAGSTSGTKYLEKKYAANTFWQSYYSGEKPIIYGHHVVGDFPKIINKTYGIDTGACHGGMLTAIELPSFKIHQIKVEQEYWQSERVKWQLPVLKAKNWQNMTFVQIANQVEKLRYIENDEVQKYLDNQEAEILHCQKIIQELLPKIYAQRDAIVAKFGAKNFNQSANQFSYKVFLFQANAGRLTTADLSKHLNTPKKVYDLKRLLSNEE